MSLFRNIMYANAPILKKQTEFFGEYSYLNRFSDIPDANAIHDYQLKKLMDFQASAIKEESKTRQLNWFLMYNGNLSTSSEPYDQIVYNSVNELFQRVNILIGSGVMSQESRGNIAQNEQLAAKIVTQLQGLGKELNKLRKQANMTISSTYIDQLDALIKQLPQGNLDTVLRTLYHLKGDILEEVGVEWLNKRMPTNMRVNTRAYSTGAIRGRGGQMIQDILVMDMDKVNIKSDVEIDFTLDGKPYSMPIKDFLHMIEKYSGHKQISISSEAEDILTEVSVMGIQAKSGYNQLPWNVSSKNTHVSIGEAQSAGDSRVSRYIDFLNGVQGLYRSWDAAEKNIKKQTQEYTAMANYCLATQLSKVLHLSQLGNQYVLTPNGFMPFVTRIIELYEKAGSGKYFFSFKGRIQMEKQGDIVTKSRPVTISGY